MFLINQKVALLLQNIDQSENLEVIKIYKNERLDISIFIVEYQQATCLNADQFWKASLF